MSDQVPPETPDDDAGPSLPDRLLDVCLYAPVGLLLTAVEELPDLADKGRRRLSVHFRSARAVGQLAVQMGERDLRSRFEGRRGDRSEAAPGPVRPVAFDAAPAAPTDALQVSNASAPTAPTAPDGTARAAVAPAAAPSSRSVDRAIPEYDTLSASQVVRRLESLGPSELEAVVDYESATRGRRTILHRAGQLLGVELPPGAPGTPGALD